MVTPDQVLDSLSDEARSWLAQAREQVAADTAANLPVLLPQLPRRLGRGPFVNGEYAKDSLRVNLSAWQTCDAGALLLFQSGDVTDEQLLDLYYHGDMEEKAMVLRVATCRPITDATVTLLGEAQRTNTSNHFEAAVCDSNLIVRAVGRSGFGDDEFNRTILKIAFVDLPLARVLDACSMANQELSRMVQDLATEREAAGRRVWRDTNLLIAHAPTAGSIARLAGGLEHGDDAHRLAAVRGLAFVKDEKLLALARERLDREPVAEICDAIRTALESTD
jgi:hypothetical protein